ncbi:MAG: hypothetical protein A2Y21_06030 [Clostridiales bacterium GWC2_40_7]|nr:MAG: hypothetical protein A2Y21_06030 [Clostridiales bacterium GWC2_40_7]
MLNENRISLARYRLAAAKENYEVTELLLNESKYKDAVNRAYYCIFNSMRAVLALEAVDFKKHSAVISYFRQNYIKTGIFETENSNIIGSAFFIRNQSDYEDFFVVSKEDAAIQCTNAKRFHTAVETFLHKYLVT